MASIGETASLVDLHTHTTASDGSNRPAELVVLASRRGVQFLAITDHDTTDGIDEAIRAGNEHQVTIIPGIELGTDTLDGEIHILGYFIDYHDPVLQATLAEFRTGRQRRVEEIVARLNRIGVPCYLDAVRALSDGGSIGRLHVARVLVATGQAASIDDAFDRYLALGRPAFVPRPRLSPADAVGLIRRAGGAAVLAHPHTVADLETILPDLVAAGLAGLEAYYAAYSPEQRAILAQLAAEFDLIPTGGSDFHGPKEREGRELGSAPVPLETVERLRQAATRSF